MKIVMKDMNKYSITSNETYNNVCVCMCNVCINIAAIMACICNSNEKWREICNMA
jgi:hypothetical protein